MKKQLDTILKDMFGPETELFEAQPKDEFGHYTTSAAMRVAKEVKKNPRAVAEEIVTAVKEKAPQGSIEKIEIAGPGFVNVWLTNYAVQTEFSKIAANEDYGNLDILRGKRVMIEYTDPNPFKQFHIGHLMTNTIGESLARIHEAAGAEVLRVNYQGDVGLHVAHSLWGMMKLEDEMPKEEASLSAKTAFMGKAYALGATSYKEDPSAKAEIEEINKKVYEHSDPELNALYDKGRRWSLEYFEALYVRLGTKFVHYFFEGELATEALAIVKAHPDIFVESEGAIIFQGEQYGLHTRVFVNKLGLPTYEAKELALNKKKFELYHPDLSIISTANEINEYFRVLMKAMELTVPEVAKITRHIGHGMLKLPSGKMSSRTGKVITAEQLLEDVKNMVAEKLKDREDITDAENIKEQVAIAAIRYSILRQGIGNDIIFDIEKSVAFHGDSGPYLQYTYARLKRVVSKAGEGTPDLTKLVTEHELRLMRRLPQFSEEIRKSASDLMTNNLVTYLYELSNLANRFYEDQHILTDEDASRLHARVLLANTTARVIEKGLGLLGIKVLESI